MVDGLSRNLLMERYRPVNHLPILISAAYVATGHWCLIVWYEGHNFYFGGFNFDEFAKSTIAGHCEERSDEAIRCKASSRAKSRDPSIYSGWSAMADQIASLRSQWQLGRLFTRLSISAIKVGPCVHYSEQKFPVEFGLFCRRNRII